MVPPLTNRIIVSRGTTDDITFQCFRREPPPTTGRVLLGITHEECRRAIVKYVGINGDVVVRRDESVEIRVAPNEDEDIFWRCEEGNNSDREETGVPAQTNLVIVTRPKVGGSFTVQCFRKD